MQLMQSMGWPDDPPEGLGDVQKLWAPGSTTFGVMGILYASNQLFKWKKDDDFNIPQLVAIVDMSDALDLTTTASPFLLKLSKGTNCIFLQSVTGGLKAFVVPTTATDNCPSPTVAPAFSVIATVNHSGSPTDTDYPAVARFAYDSDDNVVIGVRCGRKWCEIGTSAAKTKKPNHQFAKGRASKIKGWHDEQRLSILTGSTLHRSGLIGSLIPDENLGDLTSNDMFEDWTNVAVVYIDGTTTEFNGSQYGSATSTSPGWGFRLKTDDTVQLKYDGTNWAARIKHAENDVSPMGKVTQFVHFNAAGTHVYVPPADARWNWSDADDAVWVRCGDGCCTVDEGGSIGGGPANPKLKKP